MELSTGELDKLTIRLRFRVARALGFAGPDIDDIVQESLRRFLESSRNDRIRSPEAAGAFLNGISKNVVSEYRRRLFRDVPMPEVIPEPPSGALLESELFELRQSIDEGLRRLSPRDRQVLHMFYLEECPVARILEVTGLSEPNFRVVLCRAKERFRQIYNESCNISAAAATYK